MRARHGVNRPKSRLCTGVTSRCHFVISRSARAGEYSHPENCGTQEASADAPVAPGTTVAYSAKATAGQPSMARHTGTLMSEYSTYRWPSGTPLFCLIGLYALGFLLAGQPNLTNLFAGKVAVAAYFLGSTLFATYLYRFRVILDATSIRAGAFFLEKIEFADVVRATYAQGNGSGQIVIHARDGKRIRIGETINDFGACARAINARLPEHLAMAVGRGSLDVLSGGDLV